MSKLKTWRIERNLSQYELAAATGVPRWRIQLLEGAFREPEKEEVETLACALGVQPEDLFPKFGGAA